MNENEKASVLLAQTKASETINKKDFLIKCITLASSIKDRASWLLKTSKHLMKRYEKSLPQVSETEQHVDLPGWDHGLRQLPLHDNQKQYLINKGPHQPKLKRFPQDDNGPTNKQNMFSAKWYDEFPHLEYSIVKNAAFCFTCSLFKQPSQDDAWTKVGVSIWSKMMSRGVKNKGKLVEHFSSESHKAAVLSLARFSDRELHVDRLMGKSARNALIQEVADNFENKEVVKILLDVVKTLARQNIAFRGNGTEENGNFRQVFSLVARYCPVLQNWLQSRRSRQYKVTYMSSDSQNEMIQLIADDVNKSIIQEIDNASLFAVSADTTPDLSNKDQMAIVCRFVDSNGFPKERLVNLEAVNSKTGEATADQIITALNAKGLDTDMLMFQSYDFTNSMSGTFKEAQKMLQEKLNRIIPYVLCQGHRSNSVVEHSCNTSSIVKEMF